MGASSSGGADGGMVQACTVRLNCAINGSIDGRDCQDGFCVWTMCEDDTQCGSRACLDGVCGEVTLCSGDAQCPGGICEEGRCTTGCADDAECNEGAPLPVNTCDNGRCRQRCFGDQTCLLNGGICEGGVCIPPECTTSDDCDRDGALECVDSRCVPFTSCQGDADCSGQGAYCDEGGVCRTRPPCSRDVDCGEDAVCEEGVCIPAPSCGVMSMCGPGTECVGDRCVPEVACRGNAECVAPEICRAGACGMPAVAVVARIAISSHLGLCDPLLDTRSACVLQVRPGDDVALTAVALDAAGRILPGINVDWQSDVTTVVDVVAGPAALSVATAGMTAGSAFVTASRGNITSPALNIINLGPPPAGIRVTVIQANSGAVVRNASVIVNSAAAVMTGMDGSVTVDRTLLTPPYTISVFHPQFDYVTLAELPAEATEDLDVVVPVVPVELFEATAGLRGSVNLAQAASVGPVAFSLSGVSAPNVTGLSFSRLLGEQFNAEVSLPVIGTQNIPLPGGITLSAELPLIGAQDIKTNFDVLGTGGRRVAWTFGGNLPLTAVTGLIGLGNPAGAIFALLPFFEGLTHGLTTGLLLTDLPYVVDGETDFDGEPDVDGDGNETEEVPDYLAFPQSTLTVRQEQTLRTHVKFSGFPTGAQNQDALIAVGARVPGHGFVPLGMTGTPGGGAAVNGAGVKLAPRYGGLEAGDYAVAVFAFGGGGNNAPAQISIRTTHADVLPPDVDLGAMLPFPGTATWRAGMRQLSLTPVAGADLHRAVLSGEDGNWRVYVPGSGVTTVQLPAIPAGLTERGSRGQVIEAVQVAPSIRTSPGEQVKTLVNAGGAGLAALSSETEGLSRSPITTP